MNLNEFQDACMKTAIYGDKIYPILGLVGEVGEVLDGVSEILPDQDALVDRLIEIGELSKKVRDNGLRFWYVENVDVVEVMDVIWMCMAILRDKGVKFEEAATILLEKLKKRYGG